MIDIEQRAVATFQKNFAYFATHHRALHYKLSILQTAIESGRYAENYSLEYVDGHFDVKEAAGGNFLYGANRAEHAEKAAQSVTLQKNASVIETLYNFPYTQANVDDLDKLTVINSHLVATAPIIHFVNEHTAGLPGMKKIYKFIFFGVGIGTHLEAIHEKIHADSYLIVEDNLELFRLSMFVTDYETLGAHAKLFFSVMDLPGDFKTAYTRFAEDMLIRNSHLKFYLLSDAYAPKIKQIQNFAVTQSYLVYPYSYLLHKSLRISRAIDAGYHFLNIKKPFDTSPFADKPLLYLAAGPSLSTHLDWIREHRDRFVIVAVFMVCARLEAAGIVPDIVVHVDEAERPVQKTIDKLEDAAYLHSSLFILAASAPLELFGTVASKDRIFLLEDRTRYKKDHGQIEFFSVGEVGYALSLIFGARALYLLGLDLAVDQATGRTHADGHATEDAVDLAKAGATPEQSGSLRETVLHVRGNKDVQVATTPLFDASIHKVNDYTRLYKKEDQAVFNLGNGAYFEGTQPLDTDAANAERYAHLDKSLLRTELHACLKAHSSDFLNSDENAALLIRKKEIRKKAKLIERFARQPVKNLDDFRSRFVALIGDLITPVHQDLIENSDIFWNYFHNVGGYIGNLLNTGGVNDGAQTAKELQKVLSRQLYKILHAFGLFGFDYVNGQKFFVEGICPDLQESILNLDMLVEGRSRPGRICFFERLSAFARKTDPETLRTAHKKNSIGLFFTREMFEDKALLQYVRTVLTAYPQTLLSLFHFGDIAGDEAAARLSVEPGRINTVIPSDIHSIVNDIEIFIWAAKHHDPFLKVLRFIKEYCEEIYVVPYMPHLEGVSTQDFEAKHHDDLYMIPEILEAMGLDVSTDGTQTMTQTLFKTLLSSCKDYRNHIPHDPDIFRLHCIDSIGMAIACSQFKKLMHAFRLKKARWASPDQKG